MGYVHDHIYTWSKMSFLDNPYSQELPKWLLDDEKLIKLNKYVKTQTKKKFLRDFMQDGDITTKVLNDRKAPWEIEETISYSKIFRTLLEKNTLCPSNFQLHVIKDLYKWDKNHNMPPAHDMEFYIGTVARGIRSFASLLREQCLTEIIDNIMRAEAKKRGKTYYLCKTTVRDDMKFKTDIMFKYDGELYRIWSYQTTKEGIKCTSKRVEKANGKGYNILIPFNNDEKVEEYGWWLYNADIVHKILTDFVLDRKFNVMSHDDYKKLVESNPEIIKIPAIFKI